MKKLIVLLSMLPFLSFAQQASQVNIEFQNSESYSTGAGPSNLVKGDINSDHVPDILVVDVSGNYINSFINLGDSLLSQEYGGFSVSSPAFIVAAYINADTNLDIAVAIHYNLNSYINVFYGAGDGATFTSTDTIYTLPAPPKSMIAEDFNKDGAIDLATANSTEEGGSISIFKGGGGGFPDGALIYTTGTYPNGLASADFNADGFDDIAVTNLGDNTVNIFLFDTTQNSKGANIQFQPPLTYSTGSLPWGVASADFNNDNFADMVVTNNGDTTISIFLNNKTPSVSGVFNTDTTYPMGKGAWSVITPDFNGDNFADIAVTSRDSGLTVLQGDGTGNFAKSWNYRVNLSLDVPLYFPLYLIAQDLNSDGLPDLIISDNARGDIVVLRTYLSDHNPLRTSASTSSASARTSSNSVMVYPVPSSDIINISSTYNIESLTLCDMQGKSILTSSQNSISVSGLSPGIYLLFIQTEDGTIVRQVAVTSK